MGMERKGWAAGREGSPSSVRPRHALNALDPLHVLLHVKVSRRTKFKAIAELQLLYRLKTNEASVFAAVVLDFTIR